MKKTIIVSALIFCTAYTFAQKNPFEKFSDMDGVTSVFISKAMLSKNTNTEFRGLRGDLIKNLSSVLAFGSDDVKKAPKMISMANKIIKKNNYELLMRVKSEDNRKVNFFMKGKPENIQELIMIVDGGKDNGSLVLQLLGNFSMQEVEEITTTISGAL
ncbi:MAG: DUF4252 domain-containing protein [Dysgonamonadaceae bacterium]|jgi:hypothetical protein|nr:DUF4252 domain-containing protein [Dysgonamonadaceae bacterium]